MSSPRRLHRPPATERPAGWRAVGVAAVAGRADREENAAMATAALAERVVHGVGARRAGPDWTARRIRGTTAGTGSVCRSSRRSRGSRMALRTLTPHLSPPRTLPERAAHRQRRGCGRCRSRGRKRARPPELAKPRRRGFAQRPQLHCCCWYFNLNELNDGPEDRQVSRFAQFYVTADIREVPVLVGAQDCGKSALLESVLWPGSPSAWFVSGLDLAADDKALTEAVIGSVIVEAAEMVGAGRADLARMKAFVTRQNDGHLRLAYRRNREPSARRSIIVGTANPSPAGILPNDPSGNTRFVVVDLPAARSLAGHVETWIGERREQLWAEALARYEAGERANLPETLNSPWQKFVSLGRQFRRLDDERLGRRASSAPTGGPRSASDAPSGRSDVRSSGKWPKKARPCRLRGVPMPVRRRRSSPRLQPAAWMSTRLRTFS